MESIVKTSNYYAADMIPALRQYESMSPGQMLAAVVNRSQGRGGQLAFSKADADQLAGMLPKQVVGLHEDKEGHISLYSANTAADFLGQGTAGSNVVGSGILPILAYDTIMEGAKAYACCRDMIPNVRMKTESQTFPFFTKVGYAAAKSYGAEAMDLAQDIGKAVANTSTYAVSCSLAGELLDDAQGDLIADALREIGATLEMTLERSCIAGLVGMAGQTATATRATSELTSLVDAQGLVGAAAFRPDRAIVSPLYASNMIKQVGSPLAYNPLAQEWVANNNIISKYAGLTIGRSGITAATAANWRWTTSGDTGAIVFDSTKCGYLGIREDMLVDEFDDPIKWIKRPVALSRFVFVPAVDATKTSRSNGKAVCALVSA